MKSKDILKEINVLNEKIKNLGEKEKTYENQSEISRLISEAVDLDKKYFAMLDIEENLEKLVAMKKEVSPLLSQMRNLEKETKSFLLEMGESISDVQIEGLDITPKSEFYRPSWDTTKLEKLAKNNPEILECKKQTKVKATVAYKFL